MSKVLFIGDVHLSPRIPISRKDDYPNTLLNKLDQINTLALANNVSDIIFLGDIFNTKHMTLPFFIKCFDRFKNIKDNNINLYTCVGNHDILYNTDDTMKESPIQLLYDSNMFIKTPSLQLDTTTIDIYDYTTLTPTLTQCEHTNQHHILVGHYFFHLGFNDTDHTLTKDQCRDLHYDSYILGHDHTPYSPITTSQYQVHRPGSLSRGTSNTCQVNRTNIQILMFDTVTHEYTYLDLPNILSASDIYKENLLIDKVTLSDISDSLKDLLSALEFDNSSDIFATLNSIPMEADIKQLIISYLNSEGLYDSNIEQEE